MITSYWVPWSYLKLNPLTDNDQKVILYADHAAAVTALQTEVKDLKAALDHLLSMAKRGPEHDDDPVPENIGIVWAEAVERINRTDALCPHGFVLADNTCGPCSQGRPMRPVPNSFPGREP